MGCRSDLMNGVVLIVVAIHKYIFIYALFFLLLCCVLLSFINIS